MLFMLYRAVIFQRNLCSFLNIKGTASISPHSKKLMRCVYYVIICTCSPEL